MPKIVSASEAKNRLGSMMNWAAEHDDEVIVESYGKPKAVIMAYEEYEKLSELREQLRRQKVLHKMRALRARIRARNEDLTDEEAETLADRAVRETVGDMIAEELSFETYSP